MTGVGAHRRRDDRRLLGMAAHLENKGVTVLDMAGLPAQKGGAVTAARAARDASGVTRMRRVTRLGEADLIIGCDAIVSANRRASSRRHSRPHARGREHVTDAHGRVHQEPEMAVPGAVGRAGYPQCRRRGLRFHQRERPGRGAAR
ncbi:hypothetical protein ACTMU2_35245 [Cupriavidus basilensis]